MNRHAVGTIASHLVVTEVLTRGRFLVKTMCCKQLRVVSGRLLSSYKSQKYHDHKACIRCRWRVHGKLRSICACGTSVLRSPNNASRATCKSCRRARANTTKNKRNKVERFQTIGRRCLTCGRTDAECAFDTKTACSACSRARARNGRCGCGRAIRYTRGGHQRLPCACGATAAVPA